MRIGDRVGMRLVHVVDQKATWGQTTTRYTIQTAWADRPADGQRTGTLECAWCGQPVGFRLLNAVAARARRRRQAIVAVVTGILAVAALVTLIMLDMADGLGLGLSLVLLFGGGICGFVAAMGALFALSEDGVILDGKRNTGPHAFKPLHQRKAQRTPKPTENPALVEPVFD